MNASAYNSRVIKADDQNSTVQHSRENMNFIKNSKETNPLHLETFLKCAKHNHRHLHDTCSC